MIQDSTFVQMHVQIPSICINKLLLFHYSTFYYENYLKYKFYNIIIFNLMNREVKVVLLGDSGVGKSSIVLRFCSDIFKATHESTLGAAFMARTIEVKGVNFKFQIWDTAG